MTAFETLLLKNGNPELVCAYINEYKDHLNTDFLESFAVYRRSTEFRLANAIKLDDPLIMTIKEFLARYGADLSSSIKTRICRCLSKEHIETVQDLLEWRKENLFRIYNLGKKSVYWLEKTLKQLGFQLKG